MKKQKYYYIYIIAFLLPIAALAANSGNSSGWAWAEKIGWAHFSGEDAPVSYGMKVTSDQITGYVWSEKAGWISLNCLNRFSCGNGNYPYAIVSDGVGNLSGFAWSEKGGWINFSGAGAVDYQVQADTSGNLSGYAWSEKLGWINMNDAGSYYAVTTASQAAFCENCDPCNPAVLYWPFSEAQGTVVHDQSPRGENSVSDGTISGATWKPPSDCVAGNCLGFNGSGNKVSRAYDTDLNSKTYGFSVGVWLRSAPVAAVKVLAARYDSAGWKMWLKSDGNVCFGIDDDSDFGTFAPDDPICSSGKNFADNEWHYVIGTKNAVLGSIQIYADARLENSDLSLAAIGSLSGTSPTLYVGVDSDGASNSFAGTLDEFKIYDYPRSLDQIKADFNAGQAGLSSPRGAGVSVGESPKWMTDGLVGHWKMDETSGTAVADASGNGNTGTLTNAQETGTSDASGNSVTTMVDTDGSLSTTNDAYNNMILRFTSACGSIASGTERTITDYLGTPHTFTVATLAQAPDSCAYEVRHQTGGKFGNGVGFDGANDYVSVPVAAGSSLLPTQAITVSSWVKKTPGTGNRRDIVRSQNNYDLQIDSTNKISFSINNQGGSSYSGFNDDANWHLITGTYDKQYIYAYLDGNLLGKYAYSSDIGTGTGFPVRIGVKDTADMYFFNGLLDDTRIYNRALSPDEVKQLSEWGPGPVGWWKMDENVSGNSKTIVDSSGNGNNGTAYWGSNNSGMDCTKNGKYNGACQFDGNQDYIDVNSVGTALTDNSKWRKVTYCGWLYNAIGTFFGGPSSGNGNYNFYMTTSGGTYSFYYQWYDGTYHGDNTTGPAVASNRWQHVCTVVNQDENYVSFFADGVEKKVSKSFSTQPLQGINQSIQLGRLGSSGGYSGLMDEIKIYNYARTSKQIVEDMLARQSGSGGGNAGVGPPASAVVDLKFDEGQGATAANSGNGGSSKNGTMTPQGGGQTQTYQMWDNGGKWSRAADLDGTDDYISIPDFSY